MDSGTANLKEKIRLAREAVAKEEEPYKTEAFKIILTKLIELESSENKKPEKGKSISKKSIIKTKNDSDKWYQSGSTVEKILKLIDSGFFVENHTLADIIKKLKSYDYHFKQSELTLPLRTIVRHGDLVKTKDLPDGKRSKYWTYVKPKE